jgi:CDGSH-type Zn-finger protein
MKKIKIKKDGPYLVSGNVPLSKEIIGIGEDNEPDRYMNGQAYPEQETYSLCRCGKSKNHPYCDGRHREIGFDGTETASKKKYLDRAGWVHGPELELSDVEDLCAMARFCHAKRGTWQMTRESGDPDSKNFAIEEAGNCPAGRLVAWEKGRVKDLEPDLEESISLIEDPQNSASGPIWVKGGIEIESSNGEILEKRNRVTLCRCGRSRNKPYCDGSHIPGRFDDGDDSLK